MNFFKNLIFVISFVFLASLAYADSHDTQQTIIDKAKEINKKVKEKQALQNSNISSEIGKEEALPLNDPFVGDGSLGGGTGIKLVAETEEEKKNLSVFNFKLIGIVQGEDESFASIIDENGEIITLSAFEEIAPGVSLISINSKEIIFDKKGESLIAINFKNQVIERNN
jgi:hypothetical protein|tara:strand:+ start:1237 stop:1743 length:507 start_codon:yes stop_codon:yes gene_type:complete